MTGRNTRNSRNAGTNPGIAFGTHIPQHTALKTNKCKYGKAASSLNGIPRDDEFGDGGSGYGDPDNPDDPDDEGSDKPNDNPDNSDDGDENPDDSENGIQNNLAHAIAMLARNVQHQGDGSHSKV